MTVLDLMIPRYKVIADYPGSQFTVGEIVKQSVKKNGDIGYTLSVHDGTEFYPNGMFATYPYLFRPLQWWEERKIEELPDYLQLASGKIYKVENWDKYQDGECQLERIGSYLYRKTNGPATIKEYESQKK